jgi:transposase-like protein
MRLNSKEQGVYVDTTVEPIIETGRRRRRNYSAHFKAEAVGACQQAGVSIAAVARARGLNANLLSRWVLQAERRNNPISIQQTSRDLSVERTDSFLPMPLTGLASEALIRVEIQCKGRTLSMQWPASAARECVRLLRELMR